MTGKNPRTSSVRVSVVIPAYNEELVLEKCLRALKAQTVAPYEIIIVDNNSTDATVEIARRYDTRIVTEKNQGIIYTRSRGFDEARGDVIASLDADSIAKSDWVERITNAFADETLLGLGGRAGAAELSPGNMFVGTSLFPIFVRWPDSRRYGLPQQNLMYGHNLAVRRSAWQEARPALYRGPDNQEVIEDIELSAKLSLMGHVRTDDKLHVKVHVLRSLKIEKNKRYWELGKKAVARHYPPSDS